MESKISDNDIIDILDEDYDSDVSGISIGDEVNIVKDDGQDEPNVIEEEKCLLFVDDESLLEVDDKSNNESNLCDYCDENVVEDELLQVGQGDCAQTVRTYLGRPRRTDRDSSFADPDFNESNDAYEVGVQNRLMSNALMDLCPNETSPIVDNPNVDRPSDRVRPSVRGTARGRGKGTARGRGRGRPINKATERVRGRPRGNRPKAVKPNYNVGWEKCSNNDVPPVQFIYNNYAHFRPPLGKEIKTELEYWQLYFTDELIQEITNETNRYASEKIQKSTPLPKRSIWHSWKEVTLTEMKAFLGVVINMGMHQKSEIREYFSEDWLDKQPFFKDVFSRDRFFQLFWTLHLCAPVTDISEGQTRTTRAEKIKGLVHI